MKLSEYSEGDLLRAFRRASYNLGKTEITSQRCNMFHKTNRKDANLIQFQLFILQVLVWYTFTLLFRERLFKFTWKHFGRHPRGLSGKQTNLPFCLWYWHWYWHWYIYITFYGDFGNVMFCNVYSTNHNTTVKQVLLKASRAKKRFNRLTDR